MAHKVVRAAEKQHIIRRLNALLDRRYQLSLMEEIPADFADKLYALAIPQALRGALDAVRAKIANAQEELEGKEQDNIEYFGEAIKVRRKLDFVFQHERRNYTFSRELQTPEPFGDGWRSGIFIAYGTPQWTYAMKWVHMAADMQAETIAYREFVARFLDLRRTGGQIRRDWPELYNFLPNELKAAIGHTKAKGKIDKKQANHDVMVPLTTQALSEAAMLPDDGNLINPFRLFH